MEKELTELTDNIEIIYKKLQKIETFLQGITIGMAILFIVMVVIAMRITLGG